MTTLPRSAAVVALLLGTLAPAVPAAQPGGEGLAAGSARLSRVWWNQGRYVEALELDETQRTAMDRILVEHVERRRALAAEMAEQRRVLGDRLAAGDWQGAEETTDAVAAAYADLGRGEAELATRVARLLNDEQRGKVAAEFPRLLNRPLVVGGIGGRFRGTTDPGAGRGRRRGNPGGGSSPGSPPRR